MTIGISRGGVGRMGRRGFSLLELMVVILIIALVIAILIPALRGARTTAKVASTQATMRDISSATNAFTLDRKRPPGYFTASDMGNAQNETRGFTGMKNVLLDLSGGVTKATSGATVIQTGPMTSGTGNTYVDTALIGSTAPGTSSRGYFTPDKRNFAPVQSLAATDLATRDNFPELLDAFGQPIVAWVADTRPETQFAARTTGAGYIAKFYWAANAGVLNATSLGREGRNQRWAGGDDSCSMIGWGASDMDVCGGNAQSGTLEALLGSSSFPKNGVNPPRPDKARGEVVFHSAGPDGTFMGKLDTGTKKHAPGQTTVKYTPGTDIIKDYDDVVQTGNN